MPRIRTFALLALTALIAAPVGVSGMTAGPGRVPAAGPASSYRPAATAAQQDTTGQAGKKRNEEKKEKAPLPLEPARTVSFTTDEGTWISLDVSPDGRTIVFDLLGDLYTLPIEGGQATRLTEGMAFDGQPRFSPDGKRVVFTSDRSGAENVWILSLDKKDTVQVTKGKTALYQSPEWTPDGDYIVVSRVDGGLGASKLWMYHVEGGSGVALVKEPEDLKMMGAAFGPDERYIWYAERMRSWQYNAQFPQYQLAVYDRETGKRYRRTALFGSAFRPTLSPDGRWLVYGTRLDDGTGLRIRDLTTGDERWLAYPVQRDDQESRATRDVLPGMSFTPDSKALIASYGGKIWRVPIDGGEPAEIPFTVDVAVELGPELDFDYPVDDSPTFVVKQIRDATPSPDGARLAFTALDRLWVMDYPDGTPRRLTSMEIGEHQPTWSPDGRWIAYVTWSVEGGHIYRVRSDGRGRAQRLTDTPGYYRAPAWSPDGGRIVAIRSSAQDFLEEHGRFGGPGAELVWVPASGGAVTRIAPTEGRGAPHFTRDPDRIYVYSGRDGLMSMRWDGTDVKHHLKVTGGKLPGARRPITASAVYIAPDGERAIAEVVNNLYVVTVPYVGGEPPTVSVANPKSAAFPVVRLTHVGGQFPRWSADGRKVHWSIGNAHFVYDLDAAKAAEDSARAAKKAKAQEEKPEAEGAEPRAEEAAADTAEAEEKGEQEQKKPVYEPEQRRIEIEARRNIPKGVLVLRGARVVTMARDAEGDGVIENADLVVRDNRIAAVGRRGQVEIPEGAKEIDVTGATIIPGFVDTHAHIRPAWGIHRTQVWEYLANLAYGVTTTRDPQTGTTDVLSYTDMVEAGKLIGPRVYYTGPGVFRTERVKDLDDARNILKRYSEYYDAKTIKQYVTGNRQQRQWIIMAAREQKLKPTTEGALDLKLNLTEIIDGYPGHEHSFPIAPIYKDVIELVARSRTTYTPTLLVAYGGPWAENWFYTHENVHDDPKLRRFTPHEAIDSRTLQRPWFHELRQVFDDHARFVKDLVEAGGRAGVGSHGQLQGLGYHWELWAMASGGLSNLDALRVATILGAEGLGLDGDLGSIEPGKLADLIVLDRNPLADIRNTNTIRYVMKNGRLYEGDTLNEVWPRERVVEGLWWWGGEPGEESALRP